MKLEEWLSDQPIRLTVMCNALWWILAQCVTINDLYERVVARSDSQ